MNTEGAAERERHLSPGQMLGQYRIEGWLGQGAMGMVYRAMDTHLDRLVAIKVLRPESTAHPERRRRFVQEAKAASALNHPNIVTIYDISSADGVDYIAMEYIQGRTLSELIGRRGMRWTEAVKYGVQVADALAAAHNAGLVHRDLKPANVMVTLHGLVKVLDFGLAKLVEPLESSAAREHRIVDDWSPTDTVHLPETPRTEEGTIVGTVAYMSPEQAQALPLDGRSDVFSFGSLLYEMLTGCWAFRGETRLATLAAILNQEPAPLEIEIPLEVERILQRCLRKDPERRFQSMADLKVALQEIKEESDFGRMPFRREETPPGRRGWRWPAAAAVVLVAVVAAGYYGWRSRRPPPPATQEKLVAVLPFRNVGGDAAHQAFCDGLAETTTSRLTQLEGSRRSLRVVSASEIRREKVSSAREAGQAFGASLVVDGSVQRTGDQVVVTANLVDARRGVQLRSQTIPTRVEDLLRLQDRVVEAIIQMLELEARSGAPPPLAAAGTTVPGAYDYYIQGRGYLQDPDRGSSLDSAIALFRRALELDPDFALAQAGLGEAYWHRHNVTRDPKWIDEALHACTAAVRTTKL